MLPSWLSGYSGSDETRPSRLFGLAVQDWRESFYPKGLGQPRWLRHYASDFDTVEVNSTFYRLASRDAVARWVEETPDDFVFALKASRYLTHIRRLAGLGQVERYYERIEPLVARPSSGRSSGSCRRTSTATTSGWPARWRSCRPAPLLRVPP